MLEIRRRALGRGDGFPIKYDPDLAAQEVEQDRNTVAIRHSFEQTETVAEHAVDDAHLVSARIQRLRIEANKKG